MSGTIRANFLGPVTVKHDVTEVPGNTGRRRRFQNFVASLTIGGSLAGKVRTDVDLGVTKVTGDLPDTSRWR